VGGSALLFAAMGASVKVVASDLPIFVAVFFRSLFGLIVVLPLVPRGYPRCELTNSDSTLPARPPG